MRQKRLSNQEEQALRLVNEHGVLRPRDLDQHGLPRTTLSRLLEKGAVERIARGLYTPPAPDATEHRTLAEAAKAYPKGVICLLSALQFHGLTTQMPRQVWLAIDVKGWQPRDPPTTVRFVRFSGRAITEGISMTVVENVPVRIFGPAKTVADCFKFRNKIGTDVAIEALRDCLGTRRATVGELLHFARVCRVENVMRPYLEAMA
jgi:predicted transcriptional regulator of viral defense system